MKKQCKQRQSQASATIAYMFTACTELLHNVSVTSATIVYMDLITACTEFECSSWREVHKHLATQYCTGTSRPVSRTRDSMLHASEFHDSDTHNSRAHLQQKTT